RSTQGRLTGGNGENGAKNCLLCFFCFLLFEYPTLAPGSNSVRAFLCVLVFSAVLALGAASLTLRVGMPHRPEALARSAAGSAQPDPDDKEALLKKAKMALAKGNANE